MSGIDAGAFAAGACIVKQIVAAAPALVASASPSLVGQSGIGGGRASAIDDAERSSR